MIINFLFGINFKSDSENSNLRMAEQQIAIFQYNPPRATGYAMRDYGPLQISIAGLKLIKNKLYPICLCLCFVVGEDKFQS